MLSAPADKRILDLGKVVKIVQLRSPKSKVQSLLA
jgi:hypothetical protein